MLLLYIVCTHIIADNTVKPVKEMEGCN